MKAPIAMCSWMSLLGVACWLSALPAAAQDPEQDDNRKGRPFLRQQDEGADRRGRQRGYGRGERHDPHSRPFGGRRGMGLGLWPQMFRLAPEDREPLAPGEEEELLAFAERQMPRFYEAMQRLRQRHPERFREKLAAHAPRLRHLRRVYERHPRMAVIIEAHAENMFKIRRGMRALKRAPPASAVRKRVLQEARSLMAENLELEIEALETLAAELDERREQRIADRVAYLLDEGNDLAGEPKELRDLVATWHSAGAGPERDQAEASIRQFVSRQVATEVEALRERGARMQESAAEQVDQRMERLLDTLERWGRPRDGHSGGGRGR